MRLRIIGEGGQAFLTRRASPFKRQVKDRLFDTDYTDCTDSGLRIEKSITGIESAEICVICG